MGLKPWEEGAVISAPKMLVIKHSPLLTDKSPEEESLKEYQHFPII